LHRTPRMTSERVNPAHRTIPNWPQQYSIGLDAVFRVPQNRREEQISLETGN
jgi:hypothetical protein